MNPFPFFAIFLILLICIMVLLWISMGCYRRGWAVSSVLSAFAALVALVVSVIICVEMFDTMRRLAQQYAARERAMHQPLQLPQPQQYSPDAPVRRITPST